MYQPNNRPQISALTIHDDTPVTLYVDAIDGYYPNPIHEGCTTVKARCGATTDIQVPYGELRAYLRREWLSAHHDFTVPDKACFTVPDKACFTVPDKA